jgi:phospholipase/carboxylesterase
MLGPLRPEQTGGKLVVLLHGWRAHGDDLVPLARQLARPGMRFLVPAAPLREPNGGRAWWSLDTDERPAQVWGDELPAHHRPNRQVTAAREAVQALLHDARRRYAPESTALVGFSQGAMLALDVAIAGAPEVDRVAVLSGALLADTLDSERARSPSAARPALFVAHGRADSAVPFGAGQGIRSVLQPRGYRVDWHVFDGGHEIPSAVVSALRAFLA